MLNRCDIRSGRGLARLGDSSFAFLFRVMNCARLNKLIEKHLRSVVYGGTDGYVLHSATQARLEMMTTYWLPSDALVFCSIITIFGIVSGSSGASLGIGVMFIIGLASLCADAISMCVFDILRAPFLPLY